LSKIIIAIHGLGNKPPHSLLEKWWKKAIREGLGAYGYRKYFFKFKMVYWARLLHPIPLNPKISDKHNPLFLDDPYVRSKNYEKQEPSRLRQKVLDYLEKQLDSLFLNDDLSINFSNATDKIIRHFFSDLALYYSNQKIRSGQKEVLVKEAIRGELLRMLKKYQQRQILLIAHSMGSIIAYDVLSQAPPEIKIDTLVTIGSPLGLPIIVNKIKTEQQLKISKLQKLCTPEKVARHWYNLSDLRDRVSVNYNLGDDYLENSNKIRPVDKIVYNNYEINGEKNPHKSYGYLRTPEMAEIVNEFLTVGQNKLQLWCSQKIEQLFLTRRF